MRVGHAGLVRVLAEQADFLNLHPASVRTSGT